jgi:preprotein translocase subunit SecE
MSKHKKSQSEKKEERLRKQLEESTDGQNTSAISLQKKVTPPPPPQVKQKQPYVAPKKPGKISRLITFFKDAKAELKNVTWPTRSETIKSTGVLLVLVGISAIYLGAVDGILTRLLGLIVD